MVFGESLQFFSLLYSVPQFIENLRGQDYGFILPQPAPPASRAVNARSIIKRLSPAARTGGNRNLDLRQRTGHQPEVRQTWGDPQRDPRRTPGRSDSPPPGAARPGRQGHL